MLRRAICAMIAGMMSSDYRAGFSDGVSHQSRQINPGDVFDRPDYVRGFADGRASGWHLGDTATLDDPRSSWHGRAGYVVGASVTDAGQGVITIAWPEGSEISYAPEHLHHVEDVS